VSSIQKVISGGQTGVDRAALDAALSNNIEIGGYVPRGRRAEDGKIRKKYTGLSETDSEDYAERTRLNVINSDATLLITNGELKGGSKLTAEVAIKYRKPLIHVDLSRSGPNETSAAIEEWLDELQPRVLNIAGPRASEDAEIYRLAYELLFTVLKKAGQSSPA
jgi:hypothetical protein